MPRRGLGFTNIAVGSGEGGNYPLSDPGGARPCPPGFLEFVKNSHYDQQLIEKGEKIVICAS